MSFIWKFPQFAIDKLHKLHDVIKPQAQAQENPTKYTGIIQDGDFVVICSKKEALINSYKLKIQRLAILMRINDARFEAMELSSIGFPEFNLILKEMTRLSTEIVKTNRQLDALMA